MQHTIKTEHTNDDGDLIPAVIIEAPDLIWLQVANPEWEEEAAPEDERTFTSDERIIESDVPYVPLARAEAAEADLARIGAMFEPHDPLSVDGIIEAIKAMAMEIDELGAELDKAEAWILELDAEEMEGMGAMLAHTTLLEKQIAAFRARVDELEAGQGWRDFSTKPTHGQEVEVLVIQSGTYYADDDTWELADTGEWEGWR